MRIFSCSIVLALTLSFISLPLPAEEPSIEPFDPPTGLYLTWQQDPTTTMTVHWVTTGRGESTVDYRKVSENDGSPWSNATGTQEPMARFANHPVHTVELTDLEPGATYEFRVAASEKVLRFRTMPADLDEPIRFAVGGDTMHRQIWMERMNREVLKHDPEFVVWGGDLAYGDGIEARRGLHRWYDWLDAVKNSMITPDGRMVPIIVTIGNHEVQMGYYSRDEDYEPTDEWRRRVAPYFYTLFSFPGQPGYNALDFGDYLSLIVLDTDHTNPVEGEQTKWLRNALAERQHMANIMPVYHVPAYPGVRDFDGPISASIRQHWVPLFEKNGVRVVFENHDHAYKRTHPLRQNEIAPDGIVYIGDGCWGTAARSVHPEDETWYLSRSASARHAIIVTLYAEGRHFLMVDEFGETIDEYEDR